ncbi:hypothetical protein YQE_00578, partial [Dendroctonus ponderosae]
MFQISSQASRFSLSTAINLPGLEEVKGSLDLDRARLQDQIRDLEKEQLQTEHKVQSFQEELQRAQAAGSQPQQEEKELQSRLLNEVEERERSHQELHQLRKQQYLLVHLEDSRVKEKRLEDQKHNLEVCLVDATQQIQELKTELGGAEGRVRALETQLTQLECAKREIEQKLFSVVSTLRRIGGIQLDGSVSMPYRLLSPSRRWSPARGHEDKDGSIDVDPEVVRKGVRNLMQQVAQIERERCDHQSRALASLEERCISLKSTIDQLNCSLEKASNSESELKAEVQRLQRSLMETMSSQQTETERLKHMQKALTNCENDRRVVSKRLETTQNSLAEMLRNNQILQDQVTRLNNELANNEVHKSGLESQLRWAEPGKIALGLTCAIFQTGSMACGYSDGLSSRGGVEDAPAFGAKRTQ